MDAGDHGSAAKGLAIDLKVAGSGPLTAIFPYPPHSLHQLMYKSKLRPIALPSNLVTLHFILTIATGADCCTPAVFVRTCMPYMFRRHYD